MYDRRIFDRERGKEMYSCLGREYVCLIGWTGLLYSAPGDRKG